MTTFEIIKLAIWIAGTVALIVMMRRTRRAAQARVAAQAAPHTPVEPHPAPRGAIVELWDGPRDKGGSLIASTTYPASFRIERQVTVYVYVDGNELWGPIVLVPGQDLSVDSTECRTDPSRAIVIDPCHGRVASPAAQIDAGSWNGHADALHPRCTIDGCGCAYIGVVSLDGVTYLAGVHRRWNIKGKCEQCFEPWPCAPMRSLDVDRHIDEQVAKAVDARAAARMSHPAPVKADDDEDPDEVSPIPRPRNPLDEYLAETDIDLRAEMAAASNDVTALRSGRGAMDFHNGRNWLVDYLLTCQKHGAGAKPRLRARDSFLIALRDGMRVVDGRRAEAELRALLVDAAEIFAEPTSAPPLGAP